MKILVEWIIPRETKEAVIADFAATEMAEYQAQWGPKIRKIGSWHNPATGKALAIVETDDPAAVAQVVMGWNSVADVQMSIVFDDDESQQLSRQHVAAGNTG